MILFLISLIICLLVVAGFIYHSYKFVKERSLTNIDKKYNIIFFSQLILFTLMTLLCSYGIVLWNKYNLDGLHHFMLIIGSLIFGFSLFLTLQCFVLYFYKTNLDIKVRKLLKRGVIIFASLTLIFLLITVESYACYMPASAFPLINGISFTSNGIIFTTANKRGSGFTIAWYGIILVGGAIIAYFVCDHHFYQEYKRHGIIDSMFVLVLLMGILGSRFWYCAVLEHDLSRFFNFQEGGLAIMGGVLFGAISGILFILFFRRYINLRHAMDLVLPCVLIAQGIGRWGNFFNQEVYGAMTFAYDSVWWLPTFIKNQMTINGMVHLPLFLIEFCTNLLGYFVINHLMRIKLNNHLSNGDLFCMWLVWYGLTRVLLEPLRASGFEYNASYITAWVMFGGGIASIIALHIYDYLRWGKLTFNICKMKEIDNPKYNLKGNPYKKLMRQVNEEIKH